MLTITMSDHREPGLIYMFSGSDRTPPSRLVMNSETLWTISGTPAAGVQEPEERTDSNKLSQNTDEKT